MLRLIHFIQYLKTFRLIQLFTVYLRYLIGAGFFAAAIAMGKLSGDMYLMGSDLKPIQDLNPIQLFFRVMKESGLYWKFIGWSQIVGAVLLITQRFAKLGALIFFGIILNIFIITVALDFTGTPYVTGPMLLATIYLLFWDIESFQFLLLTPRKHRLVEPPALDIHDHPFWTVLGFIIVIVIAAILMVIRDQILPVLATGLVAMLGFFVFAIYYRETLKKPISRP